MNKHTLLGPALTFCVALFALAFPASAQDAPAVDSFFDVFFEVTFPQLPDPPPVEGCLRCEGLLDLINGIENNLDDMNTRANKLLAELREVEVAVRSAQRDLEEARRRLREFVDPESWGPGEDRVVDSTELEIQKAFNRELWEQYQDGDITAEELAQAWERGPTDAERERLHKALEKELKRTVDTAEDALEELQEQERKLSGDLQKLNDEMVADIQELNTLTAQYKDCLERCGAGEDVDVIDDYGIPPAENDGGFLGWLTGLFRGIFRFGDAVPDINPEDLDLSGATPLPSTGEGEDLIPGADVPLDDFLAGLPTLDFGELIPALPPIPDVAECVACEDLLEVLTTAESEADDVAEDFESSLWDLQGAQRALERAQRELDAARKRLEQFDNPSSWAESGGRRLDSSDLEAIRAFNRNVWQQYRDGDISAQEASDRWSAGPSDAERQRLKEQLHDALAADVAAKEAALAERNSDVENAQAEADRLEQELADLLDEIDALLDEYLDCLLRCRKQAEDGLPPGDDDEDGEDDESADCELPALPLGLCKRTCSGECEELPRGDRGPQCYICKEDEDTDEEEEQSCDPPALTLGLCERTCDGMCDALSRDDGGPQCYACIEKLEGDEDTCPADAWVLNECRRRCEDTEQGTCEPTRVQEGFQSCYSCKEFEPEERKEVCENSTMDKQTCKKECEQRGKGTCEREYTTMMGLECFTCEIREEEPVETSCDSPTMPEDACEAQCNGDCRFVYRTGDGKECFECREREEQPRCPQGTTPDRDLCEDQCPADGVCKEENGCYSCVVVHCPGGTFRSEGDCQAQCDGSCTVAAEQDGVQCWRCQKDCEDLCEEHGYNPGDTDYTQQILAELNQWQCVSGAGISIETATFNGDCHCSKDPKVTVDQTKPVCKGTPCGDVQCGESASCTEGNTTYTVNCNWGGWEKVAPNQFRPVFGVQ
ncbi:hypothetical protein COU80_02920 [Candidatus Peregrinibacteria bacterium CG10_big_fil_rev_8_21_14_0_10_55_24]|nr:MAG: hypothetical protein COU80_02920 [Candidatus Peregrinibacteria bacterium CG10_big_fil_rev_8_21_14_0_10_55_24]